MTHTPYIQFHPTDNPTHLSKVGNWVITFISDPDAQNTQLAITNVIPRQIQNELQVRKFIIENTQENQIWSIQEIECFDSALNQSLKLDLRSAQSEQFIQQLLAEFRRYDVEVSYIH